MSTQHPSRPDGQQPLPPGMEQAPMQQPVPHPQGVKKKKKRRRRRMPQPQQLSRSERQRRRVRRSRRQQITRRISFLILTLGVAFLAVTVFFRVEKLNVTGTSHYTVEEITAALGVKKGDNLFSFRVKSLEKKLMKTYPYLSRVSIERQLPDGLQVVAVDAVPTLAIDVEGGGCFLADAQGKLLEQAASAPDRVASVTGVLLSGGKAGQVLTEEDGDRIDMLLRVTKALDKLDMMKDVDFINVSAAYDVRFGYLGRLDVRLGETTKLDEKLRMLSRIVNDELSPSDINIIYLQDPTTAYCPPTTPEQIEQSALPLDDIIPVEQDADTAGNGTAAS
ncbi:MAG: cell division protein FtsQ/DivIB [Butyricicoccus sp.]